MATNFVQNGETLTIPAPTNIVCGDVVIAGDLKGIAAGTALSGAPVDVHTRGCFRVAKVGVDAFTLGARVYFDTTAKLATATVGSNPLIGYAIAAAGAGTATVIVKFGG